MLLHELLEATLDTCDTCYINNISRTTKLTKQLHPIPKGRAVCLPYSYMPNVDDSTHLFEPAVARIASASYGTYGAWIPNPNFDDSTVLGIVVSYTETLRHLSLYMPEIAKDISVFVTYVMPDGSLISFNVQYNWHTLSNLTLEAFYAHLLPDNVRRLLWGVLGNAWESIEQKVHPTTSNGTGVIAVYPFEVPMNASQMLNIVKLTKDIQ